MLLIAHLRKMKLCISQLVTNKWVALDGTDKDSKKDPYETKDVTRTQPVTYEVEHMPLENESYAE